MRRREMQRLKTKFSKPDDAQTREVRRGPNMIVFFPFRFTPSTTSFLINGHPPTTSATTAESYTNARKRVNRIPLNFLHLARLIGTSAAGSGKFRETQSLSLLITELVT